jgi:hypothetical protein
MLLRLGLMMNGAEQLEVLWAICVACPFAPVSGLDVVQF